MYQHIIGNNAPLYNRLKGRAMDFVPQPQGIPPNDVAISSK
jgi:hypothetical protein